MLEALLSVLVTALNCKPTTTELTALRSEVLSYILACGIVYRITQLLSLFDRTAGSTEPIPFCVEHCLLLLDVLTAPAQAEAAAADARRKSHGASLQGLPGNIIKALRETSLVGLTALLNSVLLHATQGRDPSCVEPGDLPANFLSIAWGVLRVLNNACLVSLSATQELLGGPDLRTEVLYLLAFLVAYCTAHWPREGAGSAGAASVAVAEVLNEAVLLVGFFAAGRPEHQEQLHWGCAPTLLQRLCSVPFVHFVRPRFVAVLMPTFVAACYGAPRICEVVSDRASLELLVMFLEGAEDGCPGHGALDARYHLHNRLPPAALPDARRFFAAEAERLRVRSAPPCAQDAAFGSPMPSTESTPRMDVLQLDAACTPRGVEHGGDAPPAGVCAPSTWAMAAQGPCSAR